MHLLLLAAVAGIAYAVSGCGGQKKQYAMINGIPQPTPGPKPNPNAGTQQPAASVLPAGQDTYTPPIPGAVPSTGNDMADRMLRAHNELRANVNPAPSTPLTPLVWSDALAQQAQLWANNCVFEHSSGEGYGENLYARGDFTSTPEHAVASFAAEAPYYDYATNSCEADKVCGHYTQAVWAATRAVGCAVSHCETNSPFKNWSSWDLWVCRYDPPGNYTGQKPY